MNTPSRFQYPANVFCREITKCLIGSYNQSPVDGGAWCGTLVQNKSENLPRYKRGQFVHWHCKPISASASYIHRHGGSHNLAMINIVEYKDKNLIMYIFQDDKALVTQFSDLNVFVQGNNVWNKYGEFTLYSVKNRESPIISRVVELGMMEFHEYHLLPKSELRILIKDYHETTN